MNPETSSAAFGIVGLLTYLIFGVLAWLGLIAAGGVFVLVGAYLYRKCPFFYTSIDAIQRVARYEYPQGDPKECLEALKSRLATMEKITWYILTVLGLSFLSTFPGVSSVKIPGLEVPVAQFGFVFYAIFLGTMIYYLKIVASIEALFLSAENKKDLRFQLSTHCGFLSPFSESATVFGRVLDIVGFCVLICAWWFAFEVGRRLLIKNELNGPWKSFGDYLPWIAVFVGIFSLFSLRRAMDEFSSQRLLYFVKLGCACVSLLCAWLLARSL